MTDVLGILLQTGPHGPHGPTGPHGPMGPGPGGGPGWGLMPWGTAGSGTLLTTLLWVLLLVAVVAAVLYLLTRLVDGRHPTGPGAVSVLERRYARGEIDDEEFERRRDRLAGVPGPGHPEQ